MIAFDLLRLAVSCGLAVLIGGLGYWRGSLSASGWAAASVVGTLTAGVGGWEWGVLVIIFFASSSALSRLGAGRKGRFAAEQWAKGDRRDWGQVLANGGLVSLLAVLWAIRPVPALWIAALGVLGTVTGDTWATEIGVLSRARPRMITTGRPVAPGTSGGITALGSLAALTGAALIGLSAILLGVWLRDELQFAWLLAGLVGGAVGVIADSVLGATMQAMRWCPRCAAETERQQHGCGALTVALRGWPWLTNDAVNALASLLGGVVAVLITWSIN